MAEILSSNLSGPITFSGHLPKTTPRGNPFIPFLPRKEPEDQVVTPPVKKSPDETRLIREVVRDLSCDRPDARRKALDAVMVFAWKPGWDPAEFIALGGIPALVGRLREEDEKARVQAVSAVDRLADLGAAPGLVDAGALPLLERMAAGDRYEQLRMMAGRAVAKIRGRVKE
jgi:hypothetical protein